MDHVDGDLPGDVLRRERLRRRLTLAQVAQATRVRERYLDAIENDRISELPAPVYAIGFIQIYARFLDLDPAPFVRAYRERLGRTPEVQVQPEVSGRSYVRRHRRPVMVPAISVLLLLALAGYLYQQVATYVAGAGSAAPPATSIALAIPTPLPSPPPPPSPTSPPQPTASPTPTAALAARMATAPPTPLASPTATPIEGVRIDAEILGRVWVQVESDGKVVFSGILMPGDRRTWTASKSVMLWSGNAGNVQITYNGRALGPLGPSGKVVKVTWSTPT